MATINLTINGKNQQFDLDPETPVLWVLQDHAKLVGTKYGCGIGQCGESTIHDDGCLVNTPDAADNKHE